MPSYVETTEKLDLTYSDVYILVRIQRGHGGGALTKETKEVASSSTHVPAARFVSLRSVVTEKTLKSFHTEKSLKSV